MKRGLEFWVKVWYTTWVCENSVLDVQRFYEEKLENYKKSQSVSFNSDFINKIKWRSNTDQSPSPFGKT